MKRFLIVLSCLIRTLLFEVWEKYGYMPENIQTQSVSITLEQAFDDWCVAQLAKIGKEEDYGRFMKRSAFYRNLF